MSDVIFRYRTVGQLRVDLRKGSKHFEPWWALVMCDRGITDYYAWFLTKKGLPTSRNALWGCHVSAIKGTEPPNKEFWNRIDGPVELWYTNQVRCDNGKHAWLDVFSPQLSEIRKKLGLPEKLFYHLTIGRTDM